MAGWSVRELRRYLDDRQVRHNDCFEKRELVERAQSSANIAPQVKGTAGPGTRKSASEADTSGRFAAFGEVVRVPSTAAEQAVMLFFHGFGDSARGFVSQLPRLLGDPGIRYVLPTAPSVSGLRTWFTSPTGGVDRQTLEYAHHLIRAEIEQGVSSRAIFLGGFSQGGKVAVEAALSFADEALEGSIAASTFLSIGGGAGASAASLQIADANRQLPVLCVHGEADSVVPVSSGEALVAALRSRGVPTEFKTYPGLQHAYCPEEAADVAGFVQRRVLLAGGRPALEALSARELKALLAQMSISSADCFDKQDLLQKACAAVL